jgi:membrane associated rhomboid family serine protease
MERSNPQDRQNSAARSDALKRTRFTLQPGACMISVVTVLVFIGQKLAGGDAWRQAAGMVAANFKSFPSLISVGEGQAIPAWMTLFTYIFLHAGWIHLLNNMIAIWFVGHLAEICWGTRRYVIAYLGFGAVCGFYGVVLDPGTPEALVGASLAICAVAGAFMADRAEQNGLRFYKLMIAAELVALLFVFVWFVPGWKHCDHGNSLMLHFLPFLTGWLTVRIWNSIMRHPARAQYC